MSDPFSIFIAKSVLLAVHGALNDVTFLKTMKKKVNDCTDLFYGTFCYLAITACVSTNLTRVAILAYWQIYVRSI